MFFFDTNALLEESLTNLKNSTPFIISSISLQELESIKNNSHKDFDLRYKTRKILNFLSENESIYIVAHFNYKDYTEQVAKHPILDNDTNDSKILVTLLSIQSYIDEPIVLITQDLLCKEIAKVCGIQTHFLKDTHIDTYTGYKIISCKDSQDMALKYEKIFNAKENYYNMLQNEYLLLEDETGKIVDYYIWDNNAFNRIPEYIAFNSKMFNKIKPKDPYQICAMDSLKHNKLTVLRGPAGTGKSLLALGFLFDQLECGKIDKIVIFCNTVATAGSARLGFYPGSKDEKLLDSQIGNFLASKLGDKEAVYELMEKGQLELLPMSDIRGYDTTGMHAGIYITEAQNMDIDLMKLALQRIGEDSFCILDGDTLAQVDLGAYAGAHNGLQRVSEVFRGEDMYGEVTLKNIYRSKIANIAQRM